MLVKNAFERSYHSADWKVNVPVPILLGEQETDEWTALVVVTKTTGKCHEACISTSVALTAITLSITSSVPSRRKWKLLRLPVGRGIGEPQPHAEHVDWRQPTRARAFVSSGAFDPGRMRLLCPFWRLSSGTVRGCGVLD